MIELMFKLASDIILVVVRGNNIGFANTAYGGQMSTIEGIQLNKSGIEKEFPDLKDNFNWRIEAIKRFKQKIRELDNEDNIANYIIEDLRKYGYVPMFKMKQGCRKEKIK